MRRDPERCGERWKYDVVAMKRNNFDTMPFDVVTDPTKDSLDVMVLSLVPYCCRTKEKRNKVRERERELEKGDRAL